MSSINIGPATKQDLILFDNRTSIITIPITNQDQAPYDLTGAQAWWTMARTPSDGVIVIQKSTVAPPGGVALALGTASPYVGVWIATVTINHADIATCEGAYYHELSVLDTQNDAVTVTTGTITVRPSLKQYPPP